MLLQTINEAVGFLLSAIETMNLSKDFTLTIFGLLNFDMKTAH